MDFLISGRSLKSLGVLAPALLSLLLAACTQGGSGGSDAGIGDRPQARLSGIKAPRDLQMAELPKGSYIEVLKTVGINFKMLSRYHSLKEASAYFQKGGRQVYGLGTKEWTNRVDPYLDINLKTCSFSLDLDKITEMELADKRLLVLAQGQQLPLTFEKMVGTAGGRGNFDFKLQEPKSILKTLGCDHMTVDTVTRLVFGESLEIYIPQD